MVFFGWRVCVRRLGASVWNVLVYVAAITSWLVGMFFTVIILHTVAEGREVHWLSAVAIIIIAAAFLAALVMQLVKYGVSKPPAEPNAPVGICEANALIAGKDALPMSENPKLLIISPGVVNIQDNATHNAPGGIISSGTVNVHHPVEERVVEAAQVAPEESKAETPVTLSDAEAVSLDELVEYANKLMEYPVSGGTVRNILKRAGVKALKNKEPRGEDNRARAHLYPKAEAQKAVAEYVQAEKLK